MSAKVKIKLKSAIMLADTITPVSIYQKLRDIYPKSILLESSDYHGNENSYSFICIRPLATFKAEDGMITESYPDGSSVKARVTDRNSFKKKLDSFIRGFEVINDTGSVPVNGLFGYIGYDAVAYFEKITLSAVSDRERKIPDIQYVFYQDIIAVNHFQNTVHIIENQINDNDSEIERIKTLICNRNLPLYTFRSSSDEVAGVTSEEYKEIVRKGKAHCFRGDVFQIVLSNRFSRAFSGDDFNVYRALRSINPSPYLFYFDYGSFRLFGSSPEAHLQIDKGKAFINPIAGTFKRTGDDENDKLLALRLSSDQKENSEHVMLVDLARNDLSRHAKNVRVEKFREIQFYSHVIHLVSAVSGEINNRTTLADIVASTFPAGTLTGAPKYKAMQLIDRYEKTKRGYYGGAIGFIDFRGRFNHAIMIRTFMSRGNRLFYQAGAGIVAASDEEKELQEVNNKLGALREAIEMACHINS